MKPEPDALGFDPDALREKYRAERDKRLRSDGIDQYVELKDEYAYFLDDPYVEPGFTREALSDEVDVIVVGGGFGGLLAGARLREAGVENIRILDKAGDFGGTWYYNRYPGVACDIESYVYLPLLEELAYIPKEKYSRGPEIFAHARAIAEKYDLYDDACFQTEVSEMRWDEERSRWIITTDRGDAMKARFIVMAQGLFQKAKLPRIPGVNRFGGHTFHTSRWDFGYTGGDSNGNLVGLGDKRVGIVGTGASAVQAIPKLARDAAELFVFQRTPSSIDIRANRPTDPEWAEGLLPGWHQARMENFQHYTLGGAQGEDLVNDGWTDIAKLLFRIQSDAAADSSPEGIARSMELADFMKMEQVRARVDSVVEDPATAEALKPYYRQFCKRPCFHDEYLLAFNRPNVTLVDTGGAGLERVTKKGVFAAGREYELDCLIYATGFEVGTEYARRAGYELIGREGVSLTEKWSNGITTLHGMHIHGFPNCFMMSTAQSSLTVNFTYMLNETAKNLAYVIARCLDANLETVEVSEEAESEWVQAVATRSEARGNPAEECTPGYFNDEGQPSETRSQNGFFLGGPTEFQEILEAWRDEGGMQGLGVRLSQKSQ